MLGEPPLCEPILTLSYCVKTTVYKPGALFKEYSQVYRRTVKNSLNMKYIIAIVVLFVAQTYAEDVLDAYLMSDDSDRHPYVVISVFFAIGY